MGENTTDCLNEGENLGDKRKNETDLESKNQNKNERNRE